MPLDLLPRCMQTVAALNVGSDPEADPTRSGSRSTWVQIQMLIKRPDRMLKIVVVLVSRLVGPGVRMTRHRLLSLFHLRKTYGCVQRRY